MIHTVPGDPVEQMLGEGAAPGQVAQLHHTLGLDLPLHKQYASYLWRLAHGDFGQSFKFQAPVRRIILESYPVIRQLAFSRWSFTPPSPSRLGAHRLSLPIAAARRPTALSERVLVQNDW